MLEAAGYEGIDAPEDRDALGGIVGHPRRGPDREANEPVAQHRPGKELECRRIHLGRGDIEDQRAVARQSKAAASGYKDRREKDAAREVSGPRRTPACGEITETRTP